MGVLHAVTFAGWVAAQYVAAGGLGPIGELPEMAASEARVVAPAGATLPAAMCKRCTLEVLSPVVDYEKLADYTPSLLSGGSELVGYTPSTGEISTLR